MSIGDDRNRIWGNGGGDSGDSDAYSSVMDEMRGLECGDDPAFLSFFLSFFLYLEGGTEMRGYSQVKSGVLVIVIGFRWLTDVHRCGSFSHEIW